MKIFLTLTILLAMLIGAGCDQAEKIKADFNKSVDNVKKEATEVKEKFEKTKKEVQDNIQKVENLVDAVQAFSEEKTTTDKK